ncbi:hypothetical protein NMY22_g17650 [Coprinellus aureogranulatus]|nr:hypothetical protein NMY22_g17650 [Coprinellus aureogranulatus]
MKPKTPWSASSSLPSDRLPSRSSANTPSTSKPKSSSSKSNQNNARPKSARVRELETIITALARSQLVDPDPKGGCFCQARVHPLSPYTPMCTSSCGLILCSANSPAFSCPHCMTPLMTIAEKSALVERLSKEVIETEEKEEEERRKAEEERKAAAGAFPTLGDARAFGTAGSVAAPAPTTHKVLSLTGNAKGKKKVMVSSYTTTPIASRTGTPDTAGATTGTNTPKKAKEPERLPPPPGPPTPIFPPDKNRPFRNLLTPPQSYIPPPQPSRVDDEGNPKTPRRRGKGKGGEKGKEREGGNSKENVPAARC